MAGYLTGCPDTAAFILRRQVLCRLPLVARVLAGRYGRTHDTQRFLRRAFRVERTPGFGLGTGLRALRSYPAHLHINLREEDRGGGLGRLLISEFARRLAARGIGGMHLVCGAGPVVFYRRLGFATLAGIRRPVELTLMGRRAVYSSC